MKKRELVQFVIENTTGSDIVFPIFEQGVSSLNSLTKYSWDVTSETFACTTATIFVNSVQYPVTFSSTLVSLVSSLNTLGFGTFAAETVGGSTFIYVVDNTNVYGDLQVCPAFIVGFTYDVSSTSAISPALGCALTMNVQLYAIEASPLSVSRFYTDVNCTIPATGDGNYYKFRLSLSGTAYVGQIDANGFVTNISVCSTPIVGFSYDVSISSAVSSGLACALTGNQQLYAIESAPLTVSRFYTDINCTIAFSGDTNYYRYQLTSGGGSYNAQIDLGGFVTNASGCP
jgi:hypothetical protein